MVCVYVCVCLQVQERLKLFRRNSEGAAASLAYQYQNCTREQVNSVCEERGGRRGGREGGEGGRREREESKGREKGRKEGGREEERLYRLSHAPYVYIPPS